MTQSVSPTLSEDGFYGFLLVGLVVVYMYPEPSQWSAMVRLFMGSLGALLLYLYLSWLHRKRSSFHGPVSPKTSAFGARNSIEYFPDTPNTITGSAQIVPTADLVLGKGGCSRLTSGNARDAMLAQVPGNCNPPNGSAGIMQPAQFYRCDPIPKLGPNDSTPQLPDDKYRGMPNYANPEFVLQDPAQPKTWAVSNPETINSQMAPIPASQPYFYCDLYNRAAGNSAEGNRTAGNRPAGTTVESNGKGSTESGPDRCGFQPLGEAYVSMNQKLAGGANPKTMIPPRIPNRLYDYNEWSENPYITLPGINMQYDQEMYQSGYEITDCIPTDPSYRITPPTRENYAPELGPGGNAAGPAKTRRAAAAQTRAQGTVPPVIQQAAAAGGKTPSKIPINMVENENPSSNTTTPQQWVVETTMDTAQGYHPQNLSFNEYVNTEYLPSYDASCQKNMNEYNRQIGTIPIGEGVNTYSQVNQPDAMMSNLGISFTQPLLPTVPRQDPSGSGRVDFTEFDPMSMPQGLLDSHENGRKPDPNAEVSRLDIYDPRLTGYGTSYRGYVDEMTGQPRFYYDDIEATTQYNYLTRNALDWTQFGTTVGPSQKAHVSQCPSAMDVRQMANDTFANQTIFQRMDLQQRLMLKNSHREKQRRQAPISTMNQSCSMRG